MGAEVCRAVCADGDLELVAAVDPFHMDGKPASLDRAILHHAAALATALKTFLHAVHVVTPWAPVEKQPGKLLTDLARAAGIKRARTHLLAGIPDVLLPATARRLRAGVVAMGTVSRRGLKRLFIGNTAERVLDELKCDVLAIKPPHFHTHLPRARRGIFFLTTLPLA